MDSTIASGDPVEDNFVGATPMNICYRPMMTLSAGIWLGDNPFRFSLPILLYQITIIFVVSHITHLVLCQLGQPLIISQIVAGMLLGPNFIGGKLRFEQLLFVQQSFVQLNTISTFSVMIFYFVVGVKADLGMIPKVGRTALAIAVLGTLLPYVFVHIVTTALKKNMPTNFTESPILLLILTDKWSITSYVVLSSLLNELNLLTSKLGRLAMSASLIANIIHLFADVCIGTYLFSNKHDDPLTKYSGPLTFFGFMGFIMLVLRPVVMWIIRRTPEGALLGEPSFVAVLLMALGCGLLTDIIGFGFLTGPFFFGLTLPGGAPLGTTLVERVDKFMSGVMLPVCSALGGMRMDLRSLTDARQWGFLEMILVLTIVSKFVGVILPCFFCDMSYRDTISLGLMMVTKGIYEVGHALQWRQEKVVDDQLYTVIIITILIAGGCTAPMVKYLYRPEDHFVAYKRRTMQHAVPGDELQFVACVYEQDNVNPILALLAASGPSYESPICVYVLHLIQLLGRADAVLLPHNINCRSSSYTFSSASALSESDHIVNAFRLFEKQKSGGIVVLPYVCMSPYNTMHDDICSLALEKAASLIILPFHKNASADGTIGSAASPALQAVNLKVLKYAPCSVGILVHKGLFDGGELPHRVAVYFLGGADDREALAYGAHMAEHAGVGLTVLRFLPPREMQSEGRDERIDDGVLARFRQERVDGKKVVYREEVVKNGEGMVAVIRERSLEYGLLMVGRRAGRECVLTAGMAMWSEYPELGVVGDLLASSDFGCRVPTLVVQQQARVIAAVSPKGLPNASQVVPVAAYDDDH